MGDFNKNKSMKNRLDMNEEDTNFDIKTPKDDEDLLKEKKSAKEVYEEIILKSKIAKTTKTKIKYHDIQLKENLNDENNNIFEEVKIDKELYKNNNIRIQNKSENITELMYKFHEQNKIKPSNPLKKSQEVAILKKQILLCAEDKRINENSNNE